MALWLQRHGISSTIYEDRPASYSRSGSMVLTPNALRVLDHLNVLESLQAKGYSLDRFPVLNIQGDQVGSMILGSEQAYGYDSLRLHRNIARQELVDEAQRRSIEVQFGMKCTGIEKEDEHSVTVMFDNGQKIVADLVVGADGIHSPVRSHIQKSVKPAFNGQVAVIGITKNPLTSSHLPDNYMMLGPPGAFAMFQISQFSDILFFATVEAHDRSREDWHALEADKQGLSDMLRERFDTEAYPDPIRQLVTKAPSECYTTWP